MLMNRLWWVAQLCVSANLACDVAPRELPPLLDASGQQSTPSTETAQPSARQARALVVPRRTLEVGAPRSGFLRRRLEVGVPAAEGTLLYEIEIPGAQAGVEAARARTQAGTHALAEARADAAEGQRRYEALEDIERYVASDEVNQARLSVVVKRARAGRAHAERRERQAELRSLELNDRAREDHSPFDALITRWEVEDGAWVEQGSTVLRLESDREVRVRFAVGVEQIAHLQVGAQLQAGPTRATQSLPVVVESIAPRPDEITGFHLVEARLDSDTAPPVGEPLWVALPLSESHGTTHPRLHHRR